MTSFNHKSKEIERQQPCVSTFTTKATSISTKHPTIKPEFRLFWGISKKETLVWTNSWIKRRLHTLWPLKLGTVFRFFGISKNLILVMDKFLDQKVRKLNTSCFQTFWDLKKGHFDNRQILGSKEDELLVGHETRICYFWIREKDTFGGTVFR